MSHITGGGLASNLARVIPGSCEVRIDRTTWQPAADLRPARSGSVGCSQADIEATFNMGVGMVAVLPPMPSMRPSGLLAGRGLRAWVCGIRGPRRVRVPGSASASSGTTLDAP